MNTLVLMTAKVLGAMSRMAGRGGGQALPGLVADRLDPGLIQRLAGGLPHGVILVTGTNGKTTTTKLVAELLETQGERVLTNSTGSNLRRGVVSALIRAADWRGRLQATIGLFEIDEASLRRVARELQPRHIVVLNLFRDQLDRYGELDTTAALIGQGIAATKAQLHLNADDPLVASLAAYAASPEKVHYFGIEHLSGQKSARHMVVPDSDRCPICRERLVFSQVFYAHIGHWHCSTGHFSRPRPEVAMTEVRERGVDGSEVGVSIGGRHIDMRFPLPGTYNLYNALAAMSLGNGLGIDVEAIAAVMNRAEAAFGRVERVELNGRIIYLLLIKNPAGFAQVVETFLTGQPTAPVLFAINDLAADGRDVSWLWDVPLETLLSGHSRLLVSGIRAADMAVRLHYAGLKAQLASDPATAITDLVRQTPAGGTAYILPTYTAMLELRKLLSKQTRMEEVWA